MKQQNEQQFSGIMFSNKNLDKNLYNLLYGIGSRCHEARKNGLYIKNS